MTSGSLKVAAVALATAYALQILLPQQTTAATTSAISDNHVALFVFGDSLYDSGMSAIIDPKNNVNYKPYGMTFFRKPTGRHSDGRVLPDFIAEYAKLPYLPPYLQPGLTNYKNGVNFAIAGSGILRDSRYGENTTLKHQVDYFLEMVEKMRKKMGHEDTITVLSNAVYLISAGGNDYASLISKVINNTLTPPFVKHYTSMVLGNLTAQVQNIYNQGGRKFAFQSVGPMGCVPSMKRFYSDAGGNPGDCIPELLKVAEIHNDLFLPLIKKFGSEHPGFKYSVFDYFNAVRQRVINGTQYGFKESKTACCGSGAFNGASTCGSQEEKFNVCSNPRDHFWFDSAHPNEKGSHQFAEMFWNGGSKVVLPYNLKTLFHMH